MSQKVKVDDLSKAILDCLEEYQGVTEEACKSGVLETADDAVKELRSAHPVGSEGQPAGKYGSWDEYDKGWKKRLATMKTKQTGILATVYNEKHYRLTHLLEKGHALVGGGRAQAFPHIAPVEQQCDENLIKNIRKNL